MLSRNTWTEKLWSGYQLYSSTFRRKKSCNYMFSGLSSQKWSPNFIFGILGHSIYFYSLLHEVQYLCLNKSTLFPRPSQWSWYLLSIEKLSPHFWFKFISIQLPDSAQEASVPMPLPAQRACYDQISNGCTLRLLINLFLSLCPRSLLF